LVNLALADLGFAHLSARRQAARLVVYFNRDRAFADLGVEE